MAAAIAVLAACTSCAPVASDTAPPPATPPPAPQVLVSPPQGAPPQAGEKLPAPGEYVAVDELPEAISRIAPVYPEEARRAGVQGDVQVQALVLRDGSVGDTRIVKSIPGLDQAAQDCVRQWRFKPARSAGQPVAVWVLVPIRFP